MPGEPVPLAPVPLVLLPGMLGDVTLWDEVRGELGEAELTHPARIDLDDSVPAMAARVLQDAPPEFTLAGHSLGAIVAQEVARQAPERVRGLALLNASGRGPVPAQQAAWSAWRDRTEAGEFLAVARELALATLDAHRRTELALVARNEAMAASVGAPGFLRQLAAQRSRPDSLGRNAELRTPVLVVSGTRDDICPPALQQELAASFPAAQLVGIGGGHLLPLEQPRAVAQALRRWLESCSVR